MKTRAITRQELADAMARRQSRIEARQQTQPFHQQAASWSDLRTALQAFCRGAGIEPASLSSEAQAMLLQEIQPIDDIRSTAAYRRKVAVNLLAQFWAETGVAGRR